MDEEVLLKKLVSLPFLERVRLRKMHHIGPVGKARCIERLMEVDRAQLLIDIAICDLIRAHNVTIAKDVLETIWDLFKTFALPALTHKVPQLQDVSNRLDLYVAIGDESDEEDLMV